MPLLAHEHLQQVWGSGEGGIGVLQVGGEQATGGSMDGPYRRLSQILNTFLDSSAWGQVVWICTTSLGC